MPSDKVRSYLQFHGIVFIWGFTAVLGALISVGAVTLVWYRMLIASVVIFLFLRYKKISLRASRKTLLGFFIAGTVIALHWLTFFASIKMANVSITLAMISTGAFFTSILEPIFYKRKFIWYELLFGLIVIAGLYLIFEVETRYTSGIIVALISAFLSSVFNLINGKFVQKYRPSLISFYELSAGVLFISIYLEFTQGFSRSFFQLSLPDLGYLIILGTVCTAFAFIASVRVMKHLSPYTVMLTTNLEPIYGILLAFFILGDSESMQGGFYLGALLILSTVVLNGIIKNFRRRKTGTRKRRLRIPQIRLTEVKNTGLSPTSMQDDFDSKHTDSSVVNSNEKGGRIP